MSPPDLSQFGLGSPGGSSSGSIGSPAGTFTSTPAASSRPNPYDDYGPWGFVRIGGLLLPGVVTSVDGVDKPEEWTVQKATSSSGATTVWKGTKLAESIKIALALATRPAFDAYYTVRDALRPKLGTKPPSFLIENAIFNFAGVTRVSTILVAVPKWAAQGGYWTGEVTLLEYNPPKPAKAGPASPAKAAGANGADGPPTANDRAATELQQLLDKAAKL